MVLNTWAQASNRQPGRPGAGPPSEGGPTLRAITATREVDPGDRTTRSARAVADRGGRRLVRVPRSDPLSVRPPLQGGRALGLGAAVAAAAGDQDPTGEAPAGSRGRLENSDGR